MKIEASVEYRCSGGNRHPSAADCEPTTGHICFGAGRNLAVWAQNEKRDSNRERLDGIVTLLGGHKDTINAAKFASTKEAASIIITGSADATIRLWKSQSGAFDDLNCVKTIDKHKSSVNCISVLRESALIASGAADATVKLWNLTGNDSEVTLSLLQDIELRSKYFPLALSIQSLGPDNNVILAVGGTRSTVDIYTSDRDQDSPSSESFLTWKTTLTGHEGWIRSLDFIQDPSSSDLLLASASQDKYIRLWRISPSATTSEGGAKEPQALRDSSFLSNKSHSLKTGTKHFSLAFEALLLGHEDWIYSAQWNRHSKSLQLLSASADNSLVIWEPESGSGIWICRDRLGEISAQKGSTTATGSAGGFWIGLWSSQGNTIVGLGRTGTWRRWSRDSTTGDWMQRNAVGGHTRDVRDVAWTRTGSYLLSTSADQTTRIHAKRLDQDETWFELARPQIHGYDMNCVGAINERQFISGADEKLLRVFDAPAPFADSLHALSGINIEDGQIMPHAASVPVLGLSNKAADSEVADNTEDTDYAEEHRSNSSSQIPNEDTLSRHTLWPEREKLYGHGFEVASLAVSHDASVIATACKASSLEHAVIRLYDTHTWQAVVPPLAAHSLTVTCLTFSEDDALLLSGGRDRQWTVFERDSPGSMNYTKQAANPKGHSRMILGAAWVRGSRGAAFGTAGRDKCVKLWSREGTGFEVRSVIPSEVAVTSIDFTELGSGDAVLLACGLESGAVIIYAIDLATFNTLKTFALDDSLLPALSINRVKWQPLRTVEVVVDGSSPNVKRLAVASQDASVRIVKVNAE